MTGKKEKKTIEMKILSILFIISIIGLLLISGCVSSYSDCINYCGRMEKSKVCREDGIGNMLDCTVYLALDKRTVYESILDQCHLQCSGVD